MKKVFVKEEETSTGVWPIVYLADLPSHLAHRGVPSDVARDRKEHTSELQSR